MDWVYLKSGLSLYVTARMLRHRALVFSLWSLRVPNYGGWCRFGAVEFANGSTLIGAFGALDQKEPVHFFMYS